MRLTGGSSTYQWSGGFLVSGDSHHGALLHPRERQAYCCGTRAQLQRGYLHKAVVKSVDVWLPSRAPPTFYPLKDQVGDSNGDPNSTMVAMIVLVHHCSADGFSPVHSPTAVSRPVVTE